MDNKEQRIKLRAKASVEKCPGCKSLRKTIDMEVDGSSCSCECEKCAKQWQIKL